MTWYPTSATPATRRARELDRQISTLRNQIHRLNAELVRNDPSRIKAALQETQGQRQSNQPEIDCAQPGPVAPAWVEPAPLNEMGVRKFNFVWAWTSLKRWLGCAEPTNPKFTTYFAASNFDGLMPLRKETRIARNRFIVLAIILLATLWGVVAMLIPQL